MPSILFVDDNEILRYGIAALMEGCGFTVAIASTGHEALQHLSSPVTFDLLITDVVMPDMEGLELIMTVKRTLPGLKMIAISGSFDGQFLPTAKALGVKATLEKPFKRAALIKLVRSVLEDKGAGLQL